VNTFTESVIVVVSGLPTGVTASPATFSLNPGGQQQVTLTAAASAPATSSAATVAFQGTSGSLSHSASTALTVAVLPPDFSISVAPTSLSLDTGGSGNVNVSVAGVGGFSSSVSVALSGLPAGVTASPATFSLTPGNQQAVTLSAAAEATAGTVTVTFAGTSGSLSHSALTALRVVTAVSGAHAPIRTRALRTDSTLDWSGLEYHPQQFIAYDATHRQFFVSNSFLNRIDVFDAVQEVETAQIPVPQPWGLDVSPYNGSLYVGTLGGDVYQINTSNLSIINRYLAASIGPNGYAASTAFVLSDGRLALQGEGNPIDGYGGIVVWNPVTNAIDTGTSGNGAICDMQLAGPFALSGDRARILVGTFQYGNVPVCSYDPVARQETRGTVPFAFSYITPTPDGSRFFAVTGSEFEVFDAKTLQLLGQSMNPVVLAGGQPENLFSSVISLDGKTLYTMATGLGEVATFDTTTLAQTGWVPGIPNGPTNAANLGAIDETGLIVAPITGGVGFLDASLTQTNQPTYLSPGVPEVGEAGLESVWPEPATGPMAGGTTLSGMATATVTDGAILGDIYIGNSLALNSSFASTAPQQNTASATTLPSSLAGAVDTTVTLSDGSVNTCMECFSYGPSIIELVSNGSTGEGGGMGMIVGYGFGGTLGYAGATTGVSVTVGGQVVNVVAAQAGPVVEPYPFNSDELIFEIPSGTTGTAADVTVTTAAGSTTASGAFHYVAATQTFLVSDTLQQGIYDAGRDLYYFAGKTQIQVLSQTLGKWMSPITLPGMVSATQLIGISESPDGSKLAVTDQGGQAIYVLNPDNPASATRFSLSGYGFAQSPTGLAVTNAGMVYFSTQAPAYEFEKLDTSTGLVTNLGNGFGVQQVCESCRVVQSPDGSQIYGNVGGIGFWVSPSNDQVTLSSSFGGGLGGGFPDLAVSGDGSTVDVDSNFADSSMNFESTLAYTDWEWFYPVELNVQNAPWSTTALNGEKLNQDGSILFMPLNNGIDLLARNTGRLLYRVQIPVTPASNFDPLVLGKGQNVLAVITATGVSIVDMSSLPIAPQYTQAFPAVTHTKAENPSRTQSAPQGRHPLPNRAWQSTARPTLQRRFENSGYPANIP
jgi:hypothetical protein